MAAGVTAPRRILPDNTVMVTRRCSERRFFLRPSTETNELFRYLLAVSAQKHGVLLHGTTVLSDHVHIAVTDPRGELPRFEQYLSMLVARAMNQRLGRGEAFWAPGSYNAVDLVTPRDALDKIGYILANLVAAGLVERAAEWPGVWSPPAEIGAGPRIVRRPAWFFDRDGKLPEAAQLEFVRPPGFDSAEGFRALLQANLASREQEAAQRLSREGRRFMGARRVLEQDPLSRATTEEPRGQLKPRIACSDPELRKEAIARLRMFLSSYRAAWQTFACGIRDALFPHGTYWMRVAFAVRCEGPS